ncbi:MAG TPA: hypothetical protein VFE53_15375 [Mucilaginibacter sp.]|jgi:hypothetical protein|nr:hypothetical protein [Mucilaginibacter sp.]
MENEFEEYLEQNRDRFEKDAPPPQVWQNIERGLIAHQQKKARVVRLRLVGWSVAAGLLLGIGIAYLAMRKDEPKATIAHHQPEIKKAAPVVLPAKHTDTFYAEEPAQAQKKHPVHHEITPGGIETPPSINYYARLVAQRQQQFKQLKTLDPGLYNESQKAIANLNATYNQLQNQLNGTVNRKKVMEMMIENLQMQERILANQLQLIHEAEQKNGTDDETL